MNDAHIVIDLGFGDAGKGATVDALVEWTGAGTVVRFNGGAQAGHNVVLADGRRHTFAQLGAATFIPGARTLLARGVVLHPTGLLAELDVLASAGVRDAWERLEVDVDAVVSSPYHQAAGRLREAARGLGRHGSCGVGHGEAVAWSLEHPETTLHAGALHDVVAVRRCLGAQREAARALGDADPASAQLVQDHALFENAVALFAGVGRRLARVGLEGLSRALRRSSVGFEVAQGVLLDQDHGFHPHTTWSSTTPAGALALLDAVGFTGRRVVLGVTRAYSVRHGAGPFPTADAAWAYPEPHNASDHPWQGAFRQGPLDGVLLRYALAACGGVDGLVVTHADRRPAEWAPAYQAPPGWGEGRAVTSGDRVVSLRPWSAELGAGAGERLAAQERLGRALAQVTPVREPMPSPAALAQALGLPLVSEAWGPLRTDRRWTGQGL